jgi:autotransporter-associated beta strand protein
MFPRLLIPALVLTLPAGSALGAEEGREYPLGAIGGQYRISSGEAYARVVSLTNGAPGATAGLRVGDYILGAFGKPFTPTGSYHYGVSQDLGFAVDRAEGSGGALPLKVLRPGVGAVDLTVNLPAVGSFGPAYPRKDAKYAAMYESSVAWLHSVALNSNGSMGYFTGWTGLALLGHPNWNDTTGAKPYRLSINKIRDFVVNELYNTNPTPNENLLLDGTANLNHAGGASNWQLGQKIMFLAEYQAKTNDPNPVPISVGGVAGSVTVAQALQRGAEMCANSIQWWKQPAQHSNGFSPEYDRVAGMCSHGGVTGDYMHQGWYCGINITGVYSFNGMAFSRRAGANMASRPRDGHYFGFNLNPGDPIPASIANALPASINLPKYGEDPVRGGTITDPFWYDMSLHQKFVMQLNFLARRSAWYSAGHNDDGMVGYAPEAITAYDAGGRTPGTLLGLAMYQQDVGGLDSADLSKLESLKGYITRNYMRHQEAHAYCVGAQAYQALCAPYLSDRQQRYFMENWRFYFALSRTPTGGFQYFRSRGVADNYLDETHCAAINTALPYGIANGGYQLIPAYRSNRLLARFNHPDQTWPSLEARALKVADRSVSLPITITNGDGDALDPSTYTATWTKISGPGAVSFGPGTTYTDQPITVFNQSNPPDATSLPSNGAGNYRGFSLRPNDTAFSVAGGSLTGPDTFLDSLTVRRAATSGSLTTPVYLKVYTSLTPSTATWVGDSTNTVNLGGGISETNMTFDFNDLPLQAGTTYYCYFATTAGNQPLASVNWSTGRLRVSNNSGHTYGSGNLVGTSWGTADSAYDVVFSAALLARTYSAPATANDTLTFPADNTYRVQLTVNSGDQTLVEPIDVTVNTTTAPPQQETMAFTTQPQNASAAPGGSVTLSVATSGPTPALYQWRRNGVAIGSPSTSPTFTLSNVSGGAAGDYDCVYTTTLGALTSNTARVTISGTGGSVAGGLWQEVYTGIGGDAVSNLTSSAKFPWFPDSSTPLTGAASITNYADSYGQRWTGWITPQTTGDYRFYLATDDSSELWLGTSDLPTSATRILSLSGYTNEKQWSARAPSGWIPLVAGKRYYIELRHKEGGGGDHCALAWQRSGDPAPVNGSGEIPGTVLSYRPGGIFSDIPLENIAPYFAANPVAAPKAFDGSPYSASISGSAIDPNSTSTLSYSRVSGPAWLAIAANGTLSGTPSTADAGVNSWTIRVTDEGGLSADAQLRIEVGPPNDAPDFASDPLSLPAAVALVAYNANLASYTNDGDIATGDSLTFSKVSGPSWLSVAANGAITGTPAANDAGTQSFIVRVVDAAGGEDTAAAVVVIGPPLFLYDANGTTAGSGAASGAAWDGTNRWTIDSTGTGTTFAWVDGATPVFSAGADASGIYTVTNSATRSIGGFIARTGRPLITGSVLQMNAAGSPFTVEGGALGARIDSQLSGAGGITKKGPGTLILGGNNTFTGDTRIEEGTLELSSAGKLYNAGYNNSSVVTVLAGATWRMPNFSYASVGQLSDYPQRRVLDGGTFEITGATHSSGQNFTIAATGGTLRYTPTGQTLTLSGNSNSDLLLNGPLTLEATGNISISESIGGSGSITKSGAGNLVLNGTNTFTGGLTLTAGSLILDGTGAENGSPALILNGGTFYIGAPFAGNAATFSSLSGSGTISTAYGATVGTRTISVNQSTDTTYSGVIGDATGSRLAGLAKSGAGTLTLTGTSTYTGATAVSAGTLRVNGALGNTTTAVAAAGTLGGSGRITGAVAVSGTLDPGATTPGTLTTGALTLATNSRIDWRISDWTGTAGTGHDSVSATSLNINATSANPVTLRINGDNLANFSESNRSFVLVQTTGGISGFDPSRFAIDASGLQGPAGSWTVTASGNQLLLSYTRPNSAPSFQSATLAAASAVVGQPYAATISTFASDPDAGDTLTFSKVSGPAWLTVAANGTLGGTPSASDAGPNAFVIEVADAANLQATANLNIEVTASNPDSNANGILDAWELSRFGNTATGANRPDADPDADGLVNLIEYAFDTDPLKANPSPLACRMDAASGKPKLQLTVPRNPMASNLLYVVEGRGVNGAWSADGITLLPETTTMLIATDGADSTTTALRLMRLKVVVTP